MPFNVDNFRSNGLIQGGARPSLFEVHFPTIPFVGSGSGINDIRTLVSAASLPASTVDVIEVPYFGRRIKYSGERVFQDWTITVLNDEDFAIRDMFETWSSAINQLERNTQNNIDTTPDGGYKLDFVEVFQYSKAGAADFDEAIRSYQFFGVWPKTVSDIRLDWAQANAIETFEVQFSVDYYLPNIIGQSPINNSDRPAQGVE